MNLPLQLQVTCCGEDPSGLLSTDEVCFIEAICRRLKKDPRLADLFMKVKNFLVMWLCEF